MAGIVHTEWTIFGSSLIFGPNHIAHRFDTGNLTVALNVRNIVSLTQKPQIYHRSALKWKHCQDTKWV